jgi:hypothetical protein
MTEKEIQELYINNAEEKEEEINAMTQMIQDFANRDTFPTCLINQVLDEKNQIDGYAIDFVHPFYMAQPVSAFPNIIVRINNREFKPDVTSIIADGQRIPIKTAKTIHSIWLGFGEINQIFIDARAIEEGFLKEENKVTVTFELRMTMAKFMPFPPLTVKKIMKAG